LSPSDAPPGPNAVALTGVTTVAGTAVGEGRALGVAEAAVTLGAALGRALAVGPPACAVPWRAAFGEEAGRCPPAMPATTLEAANTITASVRTVATASPAARPGRRPAVGRLGRSSGLSGLAGGCAASLLTPARIAPMTEPVEPVAQEQPGLVALPDAGGWPASGKASALPACRSMTASGVARRAGPADAPAERAEPGGLARLAQASHTGPLER